MNHKAVANSCRAIFDALTAISKQGMTPINGLRLETHMRGLFANTGLQMPHWNMDLVHEISMEDAEHIHRILHLSKRGAAGEWKEELDGYILHCAEQLEECLRASGAIRDSI